MDIHKKNSNNYDRVMSRVFNRSRSSLRSSSNVTRHDVPSSARVGAKPSVSAVSSSVFSELPTVLNDYVPDVEGDKVVRRAVKPRRTLKSLDPGKAKSPPRPPRLRGSGIRSVRARSSVPVVFSNNGEEWSESHVRQCYSSRSHTRLKELKDEIKAFRETDKLLKLRSHLYRSCGVVLDDVGNVAQDKAVQADSKPDKEITCLRRRYWLEAIGRHDLLARKELNAKSYAVCCLHFDDSSYHVVRQLKEDAMPKRCLPNQPEDSDSSEPPESTETPQKTFEACTQTEPDPESEILLNIKTENETVDPIEVPIMQDFSKTETLASTSTSLTGQAPQKRKINGETKIGKKKKSQSWWKK